MNRWYIDKAYEVLESQIKKEFDNTPPEKEFFDSPELKIQVWKNLNALCDIFGKNIPGEKEFQSYLKTASNEYRSKNKTVIRKSQSLVHNINQWLTTKKQTECGWHNDTFYSYRKRYFKFLSESGWSNKVIAEAERSSLEIVKKLGDPNSNTAFYRRGMVVGSVQSGKTANFNGVINSAIDTGYQLIIVLSGLMEDLRKQTQKRIEKDVIGKWEGGDKYKGVGNICPFSLNSKPENCNVTQIESVTSIDSDFNRSLLDADFPLAGNKILICKKNVSVLGNILLWLQEYVDDSYPKIDIPLLIVDDEADNASLNNLGYKENFDPTKTNCLIRAILNMFSKKTYLGYTATPFANLLQYRNENIHTYHYVKNQNKENEIDYGSFQLAEDLFPEHFIELLYPPSNYVGIKKFFNSRISGDTTANDSNDNIVRTLTNDLIVNINSEYIGHIPPRFYKENNEPTDSREKGTRAARKKEYNNQYWDGIDDNDTYPYRIPESLKDAIKCFIVSIAIRYSRKELMKDSKLFNPHHTMLIHISRFGTWQNKLKKLVLEEVSMLNNKLASSRIDGEIYQDFRRIWNVYFHYIVNNIQSHLPPDYDDPFLVKKEFGSDILPLLPRAAQNIETLAVNSSYEGDDLKYGDTEKKYIAIGGNRLSRGFTLEGLTINYFLRGANTMDTLMQMGRWFGYRPGYLDCCKLFTVGSNIEKFIEAAEVIEDLEEKFAHLAKLPNRTPTDFTIWIQNNPDVIKLTRGSFLKDLQELSLDFGDSVKMSTSFNIQQDKVNQLWNSFKKLIKEFEWKVLGKDEFLYTDTDQAGMLKFIDMKAVKEVMINLNTLGLHGYLEECSRHNALKKWRIGIKIVKRGDGRKLNMSELGIYPEGNNQISLRLSRRSGPRQGSKLAIDNLIKNHIFKARNSTIISSPKDFGIYLKEEDINLAEETFRNDKISEEIKNGETKENARKKAEETTVPDRAYRKKMDPIKGVLIIYLIDYPLIFDDNKNPEVVEYAERNGTKDFQTPLVGYALGFPVVRSVSGRNFVSRNVFKEPDHMNHEELVTLCQKKKLPIDNLDSLTEEDLRSEVMYYL